MSLFRYLNNLRIPLSFLSQARDLYEQPLLLIGVISASELIFWPKFSLNDKSNREPDALLVFRENESNCDTVIEIEAKYLSGLSNIIDPKCDEDDEQSVFLQYGHQLADEYCGLYCGNWKLEKGTINSLSSSHVNDNVKVYHFERF